MKAVLCGGVGLRSTARARQKSRNEVVIMCFSPEPPCDYETTITINHKSILHMNGFKWVRGYMCFYIVSIGELPLAVLGGVVVVFVGFPP